MNCLGLNCVPLSSPNSSYLRLIVFGDGSLQMQLKQNEVNRVGPNAMWLVSFIRRGDQDTDRHRGKAMWKHGENVATYVPRTEASGRGRALWESHWGCRPAGQPPVTLKHNTSSWGTELLKSTFKSGSGTLRSAGQDVTPSKGAAPDLGHPGRGFPE